MSEAINEVPAATPDFTTEAVAQLAALFPEVVADGKINLDKLKPLISDDVEFGRERFGLTWPGKSEAIRAAQAPTTATLVPDRENSVDWDSTKNIVVEGDNLQVLKLLQKHYYERIKMIYIDPPYNTGNDFVYRDDYTTSISPYLKQTGQVDEVGKLSTNSESDGRFHSNWLNMMYPRLKLARNLLTNDGVIFISISDGEAPRLRLVCDEIFGEDNFIGSIIWNSTKSVTNTALISVSHTYNLVYARDIRHFTANRGDFRLPETSEGFSNPDNDPRGPWKADPFQVGGERPNQLYEIVNPRTGQKYKPNPGNSWKNDFTRFQQLLADDRIVFGVSGEAGPQRKRFLSEALKRGRVSKTLWDDIETTTNGTNTLKNLFDGVTPFTNPKPVSLIRRMLQLGCPNSGIVLDFFAGSGTTAHAVMALNAEDGGNRSCISVQLPEPTDARSEARKTGYDTIPEITRERIRRAGRKVLEEAGARLANGADSLDIGFRAYRLEDTNFAKWRVDSSISEEDLIRLLTRLTDSADDDARPEALLAEILLKLGFSLTEKIETVEVAGLNVFRVRGDLMMAYLDEHKQPTLDQLRALVAEEPGRLVILEDTFQGNDELKANLVQECRVRNVDLWTA